MEYKLIVSDMDGTLLGDNHKITKENKNKDFTIDDYCNMTNRIRKEIKEEDRKSVV